MLQGPLDPMRIRQYFNVITMTRELVSGVRDDVTFLTSLRRALLPIPFGAHRPLAKAPFPPLRSRPIEHFQDRRVAVLATGGSGALASLVGAARAFEESGMRPSCLSLCSGSALFGFPLAAGRTADEVAAFTLGLEPSDLVDLNWPGLLTLAPRLGRGFTGFMRGERIESVYREWLGDVCLGELPTPAYAPVWNVEHNTLDWVGPWTHPDMTVARAVRMAVALPLFVEAVEYHDEHYYDGGAADVLPVRPLLDIEDPPDAVLVVNGFYPPALAGEDVTGWVQRAGSILYAASQVRSVQHLQLARENLSRLVREVPEVMTIEPVPYATVHGVGLYRQFVDHSRWADFMRAGRTSALAALGAAGEHSHLDSSAPARPPKKARRRVSRAAGGAAR